MTNVSSSLPGAPTDAIDDVAGFDLDREIARINRVRAAIYQGDEYELWVGRTAAAIYRSDQESASFPWKVALIVGCSALVLFIAGMAFTAFVIG